MKKQGSIIWIHFLSFRIYRIEWLLLCEIYFKHSNHLFPISSRKIKDNNIISLGWSKNTLFRARHDKFYARTFEMMFTKNIFLANMHEFLFFSKELGPIQDTKSVFQKLFTLYWVWTHTNSQKDNLLSAKEIVLKLLFSFLFFKMFLRIENNTNHSNPSNLIESKRRSSSKSSFRWSKNCK